MIASFLSLVSLTMNANILQSVFFDWLRYSHVNICGCLTRIWLINYEPMNRPRAISNEYMYETTNETPWSIAVTKWWFGPMTRL